MENHYILKFTGTEKSLGPENPRNRKFTQTSETPGPKKHIIHEKPFYSTISPGQKIHPV